MISSTMLSLSIQHGFYQHETYHTTNDFTTQYFLLIHCLIGREITEIRFQLNGWFRLIYLRLSHRMRVASVFLICTLLIVSNGGFQFRSQISELAHQRFEFLRIFWADAHQPLQRLFV